MFTTPLLRMRHLLEGAFSRAFSKGKQLNIHCKYREESCLYNKNNDWILDIPAFNDESKEVPRS